MRALFRPEARTEAREARSWYESQAPGLGLEFARALEVTVQSAVRMPRAFSIIDGECRRVLMRRFPYSVIFLPSAHAVLVVAVFHHRRKPRAWASRVDG